MGKGLRISFIASAIRCLRHLLALFLIHSLFCASSQLIFELRSNRRTKKGEEAVGKMDDDTLIGCPPQAGAALMIPGYGLQIKKPAVAPPGAQVGSLFALCCCRATIPNSPHYPAPTCLNRNPSLRRGSPCSETMTTTMNKVRFVEY